MGARIYLAMLLGMPALALGQAFNGNFESLQPNGIPTAWKIVDPSGGATANDGYLGKRCAKAWVYKNFESGIWQSTSDLTDANASQVTGYYKYIGDRNECDKATVSYLLGSKDPNGLVDTLAFGLTELKLSSEYKKFDLSVDAKGSGDPTFVSMELKPYGHCNVHGQTNCCFLYVDDIILAGYTTVAPSEAPIPTEGAAPAEEPGKGKKGKKEKLNLEETAAPENVETPAEQPVEEAPSELNPPSKESSESSDEKAEEAAEPEKVSTPEPTKEAPAEETPAEEAPAKEETEGEPLEGWDSEEESSDGGLF